MTKEELIYQESVRIARYMWEKYYKEQSPEWGPLDDTLGVLSQIDNMIAGMDRSSNEEYPMIGKGAGDE
jgi:hypothetical protein